MKNEYGTLCDYRTGNAIRPATKEEWLESRMDEANGGPGTIVIDWQTVYVDGGREMTAGESKGES